MEYNSLQSIDASTLTPIVRKSLRRDDFTLLDWRVRQLGGGIGNPVSVGLYRFEGVGQEQNEQIDWSVVLKIIQSPANLGQVDMGEGEDQSHWNYWRREPLIYQSGLLDTLPDGLIAPRCFGSVELPGNVNWLWLEDVTDAHQGAWSLDRYALAARHLGQLNGMYVSERSLPSFPWLAVQRTRSWIALIPWQAIAWEHPRMLQRYPKPEACFFRRILLEHQRFLALLERLPPTFCHGDTYPTNFMARISPAGAQLTVALDWALSGIAPLGDDLGQLVLGAQTNLKDARLADIDAALFESYLAGLRDRGCRVDPRRVRFGYTASAALRIGLFSLFMIHEELDEHESPPEQAGEHAATPECFEEIMAAEACDLLGAI